MKKVFRKNVFRIKPTCNKKYATGLELTTDMEVFVGTRLEDPFINGAEDVREQYMRLYHFDYVLANCTKDDFTCEKKWYYRLYWLKEFVGNNLFAGLCFLFVFFIAYLLKLFGVLESFQQFVVVVLSAAATYVIVCLTMNSQSKHQALIQQQLATKQGELQKALMEKQSNDTETKDKNIKVFENKIHVYSEFISKMWKTLEDDEITNEEIREIRSDIFKQLIFYIDKNNLPRLATEIESIKSTDGVSDIMKKAKITGDNIICFSTITEFLREDAYNQTGQMLNKDIHKLWSNFRLQPRDIDDFSKEEIAVEETNESNSSIATDECSLSSISQFWHFAMLGAEEQIKALREGIYELNLVEYNEEWRTNLIKQIQENDLIFLFRSGGWGYMGVYRALGWRIFEFGDNEECKETIHLFGKQEQIITDKDRLKKDLEKYDIYYSKGDGASLCSSIIVEPLAFARNGIGNPGGVYRRTISRYYQEYGMKQLARFMAIMDNENEYNAHYNGETTVEMGCNKEAFKKILDSYNIQPAERDENGNWIIS